MKKLILSAAFVAVGTFAMAQQTTNMQKMDPAKMEQKRADHLKKMKADLDLSDAQVKQIMTLQEARMTERKQNAPQIQAERKAKMEEMKARRMQNEAEMKKILTPAQYQKWEASKQQKMHRKGTTMKGKQMMKVQAAK